MVRAGPGDRLYADDTFVGEGWGVASQYQTRGARHEFGEAGDRKVLVIEGRIAQDDVRSLYDVMLCMGNGAERQSMIMSHTFLTTGSTHGLLSSSR